MMFMLEIGYDCDGFELKIWDFVDNYNKIIDEIKILICYGELEFEEDGVLVGDLLF